MKIASLEIHYTMVRSVFLISLLWTLCSNLVDLHYPLRNKQALEHSYSTGGGASTSRPPLALISVTTPDISMVSIMRAARL